MMNGSRGATCALQTASQELGAVGCLAARPAHSLQEAAAPGFLVLAGLTCLSPSPLPADARRTLKRKSSNTKRLSPAPQLGPSSDAHTSYYSESVVRESYFGSPRAPSLARSSILDDQLLRDPYWSKCLRPFSWGLRCLWKCKGPNARGLPLGP